jgi:hypothetical protein
MSSIEVQVNLDDLDFVRRKLSFECNKDFTSEETIKFLIERELNTTKKSHHRAKIREAISNDITYLEAKEKLGVSKSTFYRHRALEKGI